MSTYDFAPLLLTLKLALVTTTILLFIGMPLAVWLAARRTITRQIGSVIVAMPLVLPPSVLGFYLLLAFSPSGGLGGIGAWLENSFGIRLAFSFTGLVIGSIIFSLPFMVQPLKSGLESIPISVRESAWTMGRSKVSTFFRITIPNIKSSIFSGIMMAFAHTLGEFGVVLMIGGNIPGETRVASIAIYDEVEAMNYAAAHSHAVILVVISFTILLVLHIPKILNSSRAKGDSRVWSN